MSVLRVDFIFAPGGLFSFQRIFHFKESSWTIPPKHIGKILELCRWFGVETHVWKFHPENKKAPTFWEPFLRSVQKELFTYIEGAFHAGCSQGAASYSVATSFLSPLSYFCSSFQKKKKKKRCPQVWYLLTIWISPMKTSKSPVLGSSWTKKAKKKKKKKEIRKDLPTFTSAPFSHEAGCSCSPFLPNAICNVSCLLHHRLLRIPKHGVRIPKHSNARVFWTVGNLLNSVSLVGVFSLSPIDASCSCFANANLGKKVFGNCHICFWRKYKQK